MSVSVARVSVARTLVRAFSTKPVLTRGLLTQDFTANFSTKRNDWQEKGLAGSERSPLSVEFPACLLSNQNKRPPFQTASFYSNLLKVDNHHKISFKYTESMIAIMNFEAFFPG